MQPGCDVIGSRTRCVEPLVLEDAKGQSVGAGVQSVVGNSGRVTSPALGPRCSAQGTRSLEEGMVPWV